MKFREPIHCTICPKLCQNQQKFFEIFWSGRSLVGHLTVKKEKNCNNNKFDSLHCFFIFIPRRSRGPLKMILWKFSLLWWVKVVACIKCTTDYKFVKREYIFRKYLKTIDSNFDYIVFTYLDRIFPGMVGSYSRGPFCSPRCREKPEAYSHRWAWKSRRWSWPRTSFQTCCHRRSVKTSQMLRQMVTNEP